MEETTIIIMEKKVKRTDPEYMKLYMREYYDKNKETCINNKKKSYRKNIQKISKYKAEYWKSIDKNEYNTKARIRYEQNKLNNTATFKRRKEYQEEYRRKHKKNV